MPLGAARLTLLAFQPTVAAVAEVIRKKQGISALGNAQVDTAQSKFGGASALFDGTGDYLDCNQAIIPSTGDFTLECWMYNTSTTTTNDLMGQWSGSAGSFYLSGRRSDNLKAFFFISSTGAGNVSLYSTNTISLNTWYHIAVSREENTFRLFIDGNLDASATVAVTSIDQSNLIIGSRNGSLALMEGNIDELRISDTARYTTDFTPSGAPFVNDDNTKLLLHTDGTDASTFFEDDNGVHQTFRTDSYSDYLVFAAPYDATSNIQDVCDKINTSATTATITSVGTNTSGSTTAKFYGHSFQHTQGDDGISYTLGSSLGSAASSTFVIEGWFRATSTGTNWAISTEDTGGRCIFSISGSTAGITTSEGNQNFINVGDTTDFHHVAIVCDAGTKRAYLDGDYLGAWVSSNTAWSKLSVGQFKNGDANDFDGYIQDLRVYSLTNKGYTGTSGSGDITVPESIIEVNRSQVGVTAVNNAQIDTAQYKFGGSSALFDGTNDYLKIGDDTSSGTGTGIIPTTGEFTLECWVRFNDNSNYRAFITQYGYNGEANPVGRTALYLTNGNKFAFFINGGGAITGTTSSSTGVWYHIAATRDSSNVVRLFVNGTEEGTNFTSSASIVDSYTAIGATSNSLDFDMNGHIDEMRVSNVARYTANFTAPTEPFVNDANTLFLSHFDGTDASTVFRDDNGAQGRGNAKVVTANGNAQIDTAQSKFGGSSALFDGSQDYLKSIDDFDTTTDWTVECWVYLPSGGVPAGDYPTIINYADQNTNKGWALTSNPDERLSFISSYDGSSGMVVIAQTGTGVLTAETWHHIAFVKEGTTGKIYVDGVLKATNTSAVIPVAGDGDTHLHIGGGIGGLSSGNLYSTADIIHYTGHIDEVRISNTARYTSAFTAPTEPFTNDANTLLLLHMDGVDASTTFLDDCGRTQTPLVSDGSAQIDTAQSKFGGSSMVTASSQSEIIVYDATTYMPSRETNTWTVEMWIRPASVSGNDIFFDNRSDAVGNGWLIYLANGVPYWYQANTNRTGGGTALSTNTWYHIAVSYDGSNVRLFVDGTQRGSDYAATGVFVVSDDCWIGNNQRFPVNTAGLDGHIDELRVSNTARYTTGFTAPTEPFQNDANTELLIHFDGTDGSTDFIDDNGKESA